METHRVARVTRDGKQYLMLELEPDRYIEVTSLENTSHADIHAFTDCEKETGVHHIRMARRYFSLMGGEWEDLEPIEETKQ